MANDLNGGIPTLARKLSDDTLLVFLSDSHIGGDPGRDIFESPDDLVLLFDDLDRHQGPVELVLSGDFFDFLRLVHVPDGQNRASATISRPEYRALFGALRRLASGADRHVVYMPGNHDAEVWWNPDVRAEILREGLVHEFALSYAATFASAPGDVIYCEHGNEYDESNTIGDYKDALDTPLGHHIVTEIIPRLPSGGTAAALQLSEINHVFPLTTIPQWMAGRLFYALVTQAIRWLLIPLLILYVAFEIGAYFMGEGGHEITALFVELIYDAGLLLIAFALFFYVARRIATRAIRNVPPRPDEAAIIRGHLEAGDRFPLGTVAPRDVAVFISGHTHAPGLATFARPDGGTGVVVNSGCWLRQLHPAKAHLRAPTVFFNVFVQTHVRITFADGAIEVDLWEHPRPAPDNLNLVERIVSTGRIPATPAKGTPPRVLASGSVTPRPASA